MASTAVPADVHSAFQPAPSAALSASRSVCLCSPPQPLQRDRKTMSGASTPPHIPPPPHHREELGCPPPHPQRPGPGCHESRCQTLLLPRTRHPTSRSPSPSCKTELQPAAQTHQTSHPSCGHPEAKLNSFCPESG